MHGGGKRGESDREDTVHLTLSLTLPRDEMTVPVARHVIRSSMREIGVDRDCVGDLELALTEACTNVLKHSGPGDEYELSMSVEPDVATLRVIDTGRGFDFAGFDRDAAAATAEEGRGVQLMHALVDQIRFTSVPEEGTVVHLQKELRFDPVGAYAQLKNRQGSA
jgi:serine/threonine-protein kinase RsbW